MGWMTMEEKYASMGETLEVGDVIGDLKVLEVRKKGRRHRSYLCRCTCGNEVVRAHSLLTSRKREVKFKNCGCRKYAQKGLVVKHKRIYNIWYFMNDRCSNPRADNYDRYGAIGVYVVDEWKDDFETFLKWALDNGYQNELTIDRINRDKPYSPENCRWTNLYTQAQNRGVMRNNKTGIPGVSEYKYGYKAGIMRNGKRLNLGTYKTIKEAKEAREKAEEYFKEYNTLEGYSVQ